MTVEARSSRVRPDRQELIRLRTLLLTASLIVISQPFQGLAEKKKPGASGANAQEIQWTGMGTIPRRQP